MIEKWQVMRTGKGDAAWNMATDEALLEQAATIRLPVLRFYSWNELAATFGYFQKYRDIEQWTPLRPLIRRPTGGGLVPHDKDWTYSLVFPPGHKWYELRAEESYKRVHEWISGAFARLRLETKLAPCCAKEMPGQCFVGAEKFDLLLDGQKIAGAAQRRNKLGLMIQGSVQSHPENISRAAWEEAMLQVGNDWFGVEWQELKPGEQLLTNARRLQEEKYARAEYNERR